jgi:large conductance mechanosensitive channel
VAFVLYFFIVKFLDWIMKSKREAPPPPPTRDQELLMEIRHLLKEGKAGGDGPGHPRPIQPAQLGSG